MRFGMNCSGFTQYVRYESIHSWTVQNYPAFFAGWGNALAQLGDFGISASDPIQGLNDAVTGNTLSAQYTRWMHHLGVSTGSRDYQGGTTTAQLFIMIGTMAFGGPADAGAAAEDAVIPAGSTADAATSGSRITAAVRGQYFKDGAEPPICSYCRQNPAEHLDHVIPRSQGGDLSPENLTPACSWCNLSKGARVAPVNPPAGFVGEWPPSFWPSRMLEWWYSSYGGG
jgi:hypothetical protein